LSDFLYGIYGQLFNKPFWRLFLKAKMTFLTTFFKGRWYY
jgi:hypothetical protein